MLKVNFDGSVFNDFEAHGISVIILAMVKKV